MATILLVGGARNVDAFATLVVDGHRVERFDPSVATGAPPAADLTIDLSSTDENLGTIEYPEGAIVFTDVSTSTATEATRRAGGRHRLGLAFLPGVSERSALLEISAPLGAPADLASRGADLLREVTGREIEIVEDRVGLISARVLAMVINEAAFALMDGVADAADIDTAMKLGTNYPNGPLAWVDTIGAGRIVAILDALHAEYGEERYRPAVLLRQHARAGLSFHG